MYLIKIIYYTGVLKRKIFLIKNSLMLTFTPKREGHGKCNDVDAFLENQINKA